MAFHKRGFGKFGVSSKEDRTAGGILFDSKLEKNVWEFLSQHVPAAELHLQTRFVLQPSFYLDSRKDVRVRVSLRPDFILGRLEGSAENPIPGVKTMVVDSKGMDLPTGRLQIKLFEHRYGLPVILVKSIKQAKEVVKIYQSMKQVNEDIVKAAAEGGPIRIEGYCSSEGTVKSMTVFVVGREGYLQMIQDSLEQLEDLEYDQDEFADVCDGEFSNIKQELKARYQKRLEPTEDRPSKGIDNLTQVAPGLMMHGDDPNSLSLFRLEVRDVTILQGGVAKKLSKNPKVRVSQKIEAMLPLSKFLFRIDLKPGKYASYTC